MDMIMPFIKKRREGIKNLEAPKQKHERREDPQCSLSYAASRN